MELKETLSRVAGRLIKPLRSGEEKLAWHRLGLEVASLYVESSAFADGTAIPDVYAGEHGRSPAVRWSAVPPETREIVLLVEDPDAPFPRPFVHWIVYGIGPTETMLPEGLPPTGLPLASGAIQGRNTMHRDGYVGPMPPKGHGVHHYHVQVFALDARLDLAAPGDRDHLVRAMRGHVVGFRQRVGTYER